VERVQLSTGRTITTTEFLDKVAGVGLIKLGIRNEDFGYHLIRASMVIIFFFFGYQKWFEYEVERLIPYISNGPLIFWLYPALGMRGATCFLGVSEWTFVGIGQAATVRVAFELGASAPRVAHRAGVVALLVGVIIMMACGLLIWMAPRAIAGVYLDLQDPANHVTSVIVLEFLTVAAVFQIFDGIQVIAAGALRGHRDTAVPLLIAAFGYWGIGFTGGWLLAFPLSCGPIGLWFGLAGGLAVVAGLLTLRLLIRARTDVHKGTEAVAYGRGRTMMRPAVPVSDHVRGK
jgi:uncharacterized membrane protein YkgB